MNEIKVANGERMEDSDKLIFSHLGYFCNSTFQTVCDTEFSEIRGSIDISSFVLNIYIS